MGYFLVNCNLKKIERAKSASSILSSVNIMELYLVKKRKKYGLTVIL